MAVRIRLSDGSAFLIDREYAQVHELACIAIERETEWILVKNAKGLRRSINPLAIVALEETTPRQLALFSAV